MIEMKLTAVEPCIFCRIIKGELPSYKVYEDNKSIAFLDIYPINEGHLLVMPKEHYKTITDMPCKLNKHLAGVVWELVLRLQKTLDPPGIKIIQNNNEAAGQEVPHYHIHLLPRYEGDGERYKETTLRTKANKDKLLKLQEKLQKKS
ncbi:MAG: HIT family protein [Candidatus Nanoarchaeia archaeon]|jgi:histidine triad (HIT) family protein